ncbi:MAG: YkgJ family cysteine cluster protein [Thaumarchaeota archaeon]|nr:YkgJ family cysteine cluster protein [Nitrososphaerota archaeon]MCL5316807.1 YkgJ family cysteine cluster protein [Nitrososphaerota archaeon]
MNCAQCGVCCRIFFVNLTEDEYKSGRYKTVFDEYIDDFEEAETVGANILAHNKDEECIYLKDKKCGVHKNRPASCRAFFCDTKERRFQGMIKKIESYKQRKESSKNKMDASEKVCRKTRQALLKHQ